MTPSCRWASAVAIFVVLCTAVGCGSGASAPPVTSPAQNPAPTLSSVSPSTAVAGSSALTLSASGTGFIAASVFNWNGAPLPTTLVSATSLTAQIPAADLASASTASLTVQNPTPGGGTSAALTFSITAAPNPAPSLTALSPATVVAGSPAITLTLTGASFLSSSQVLFNGNALTTTFVSATALTAQIPAASLTSASTASVTVQSPTPGGGTSAALAFTVSAPAPVNTLTTLNQAATDIVWDASRSQLYLAVPATAAANPGSITVVDPFTGAITASHALASAPSLLALSDDSTFLYTVIGGGATIERLLPPSFTTDIQFSLAPDPTFGTTYLASDVKVQPGAPHTIAASFAGSYSNDLVAIFDDTVKRSSTAGGPIFGNSLQWKADGSALYASYGLASATGTMTDVSDDDLLTMPVTPTGLGTVTTYASAFRAEGFRLHTDPTTGYVYGDYGEFLDPATGRRQGNLRAFRPNAQIGPGEVSILDPALQRIFTAQGIALPNQPLAIQIQAFDPSDFRLLDTIILPATVGSPTNLIRWGNAGLALITSGYGNTPGKLYLLDGSFVNPSGPPDTTTGTAVSPVPTLTALTPLTTTAGTAASVTITVTGRDFLPQATLAWNGTALPTTVVSGTQLSAQLPSANLTAATLGSITASNTGTPASNALPFSVNPAAPAGTSLAVYPTGGNDIVWNPTAAKLYISQPGIQGETGDSIAIVDPISGAVSTTGFLGSDPDRLSLSSDNQLLYASLVGIDSIEQLSVPALSKNLLWYLGNPTTFDGPYYALDLQAEPGSPQTTAVTLSQFNVAASVTIFDGSTTRPNPLIATTENYASLQWAGANPVLYAISPGTPEDLITLAVGPSGATTSQVFSSVVTSDTFAMHYDTGTSLLYTDLGQILRPTDGTTVANLGASGLVIPDSTLNRIFVLGQTSAQAQTSNYTLQIFDQTTFSLLGSVPVSNVVGVPMRAVRWGTNGFAFVTRVGRPSDFYGAGPGQLYVLSGSSVIATPALQHAASMLPQELVQKTWTSAPHANRRPQAAAAGTTQPPGSR